MGGIVTLVVCGIAVFLTIGTGAIVPAIINMVVSFWTLGVMHNFKDDPDSIPGYAVGLNFLSLVVGIASGLFGLMAR